MLVSGLSGLGLSPAHDIMLCSWARYCDLTVPLSTQVYKWVPWTHLMLWVAFVRLATHLGGS